MPLKPNAKRRDRDWLNEQDRRRRAHMTPEQRERKRAKQREAYHRNKDNWKKATPEQNRKWNETYKRRYPGRLKQLQRAWEEMHPERRKAIRRKTWAKHRLKRLAENKAYRQLKRSELAARRRERYRNDPGKYNAICSRRRALRMSAATDTDRDAYRAFFRLVKSIDRIHCYWCNRLVARGRRTVDHIIPLAKGGKDCVFNLCCSCRSCNSRKCAKRPEDFAGQFELLFASDATSG